MATNAKLRDWRQADVEEIIVQPVLDAIEDCCEVLEMKLDEVIAAIQVQDTDLLVNAALVPLWMNAENDIDRTAVISSWRAYLDTL